MHMVMPTLLQLPAELLLEVVSSFDPESDRSSLRNLSLTSSILNVYAQPALFSSYSYRGPAKTPLQFSSSRPFTSFYGSPAAPYSLLQFIRTIVRRPDLARKVKSIDCREGMPIHDFTSNESDRTHPVKSLLQVLKSSAGHRWGITLIKSRKMVDAITFLVSCCPELVALHTAMQNPSDIDQMSKLFNSDVGEVDGLQNLRAPTNLRVLDLHRMNISGPNFRISALLQLHSLDTIIFTHCAFISNTNYQRPADSLPRASCNISTMALKSCLCRPFASLKPLILASRGLRVFEFAYDGFGKDAANPVNNKELVESLHVHEDHLEELALMKYASLPIDEILVLSSLKSLTLHVETLYDSSQEMLPTFAEELTELLTRASILNWRNSCSLQSVRILPENKDINSFLGLPGDCNDRNHLFEAIRKLRVDVGNMDIELLWEMDHFNLNQYTDLQGSDLKRWLQETNDQYQYQAIGDFAAN